MAQVSHEVGAQGDVQAGSGGQAPGHFGGAARVSRAESVHLGNRVAGKALLTAQLVQVSDSEFEYVGLFQFADVLALGLQGDHHQFLELVQAPVDASAAFAFQHWFHDLNKKLRKFR